MDECLLPSEIARLVFGYLEDEGCTEAAQKFLETSESLKECRSRSSQGVRFRTRVLGFNLVEMLQLVSRVYSLVEERTRRTPVPKEIAHRSFLEQLNYLLNVPDQSDGSELVNGVAENNTGLLKALNRTMFENTTFHKKLAENINKMRTTPEGLAPESIAESIVKEKGFEELIDELLDTVPVTDINQTGGKIAKENRPVKIGSNNHHSVRDDGKKKTPDNSFDAGKSISNCSQISIEDENAAAVQSILESCHMPSWKIGSDCSPKCPSKSATSKRAVDTSRQLSSTSILDKAMVDCVTPLKEIAFKTYNNNCALQQMSSTEQADSDRAMDTESVGGTSVNGDECHSRSPESDHSASPAVELLNCTPLLLVCDTPNSQYQTVSLGVTSCNVHTKAEDRPIKSRFRRILPKPTNTSAIESNGRISFPNGLTLKVLNQSLESLTEIDKNYLKEDKVDRIVEDYTKVLDTQVENKIDENVIGDVNENLVVEKMGLSDIQKPKEVQESSDNLREKEFVKTDICSAESYRNFQDQSSNIDKSSVEDKITPVDRQGPRKKLSLSTPRRGRHIRSLDFTTPNKKILGQRSKTSPKQILHQPKFRQSKLRSNLFKSPPNKLQTIQDAVENENEHIEKNVEGAKESTNQDLLFNVVAKKSVSEILKVDKDVKKVENPALEENEKSKAVESTWDSNLRALIGKNTNNCSGKRSRKRLNRKAYGMNKRSSALKKIEENDVNSSHELKDQISSSMDVSSVQNTSESKTAEDVIGTKDKGSNVSPTTTAMQLKTSPQHIFQTPLKFDQPSVPQTPILDTPLLKSIIDDTKIIDPDLLLTPSFRTTPFKPASEKKVTVQTLSPSKMLANKSSEKLKIEKLKIESVKKSSTFSNSATTDTTCNGANNLVNNFSPKSSTPSVRRQSSDRTQISKNNSKKNGASGKSDNLIQSLVKQAEMNILGSVSDLESDDDEESEIKKTSGVSKKGNKKHKSSNSDSKANSYEVGNKSTTDEDSVLQNSMGNDGTKSTCIKESSPAKKKTPSKKNVEIQDSTCLVKDKFSPIKSSFPSNTPKLQPNKDNAPSNTLNQSVKENVEVSSKSASSPSAVRNIPNENQNKINSPKTVTDSTTSSCGNIPPKKKYVQTILLSSPKSVLSRKSLKVKNSTANNNIVVESTPKLDKKPTDQQTIDFLLEKKKRLLSKLKEPIRTRKKKSLGKTSNNNKSSIDKVETVVEPNQNHVPEPDQTHVPEPDQTHVPEPDQTHVLKPDQTHIPEPDQTHIPEPDQTHVPKPDQTHVPEPRSPTPLDKCEPGKRIIVGNELYEHVFHDENRHIKVSSSQRTIVDDKDLSISIFDVDMDGKEFETVFVAQPLNTLFEFIPFESSYRNVKADEVHLNRKDDGNAKQNSQPIVNLKIVSKSPVVNGTCLPHVDRTSSFVHLATPRIPSPNQDDKSHGEGENRHYKSARNLESTLRKRHTTERSRNRYSSSCSPPRRGSRERYESEGRTKTKHNHRNHVQSRGRDRSRERHRSRSRHHRDKSRGNNREESKRESDRRRSRTDSASRSKDRLLDKSRRNETRRESRKHRDKSNHSSSSRTKHRYSQKHNERPKKNNRRKIEDDSSEDGEVRSSDGESSDEYQSATKVTSHHSQSSSRTLSDASAARITSRTQLGKRTHHDDGGIIAEKRPKTDDAQKLLKNMDSEHLEKFLSVVHPED